MDSTSRIITKPTTLRGLRDSSGLSLKEVADVLGVTAATVSNWELGRRTPTADHVEKLCEFYGVKPSDLGYQLVRTHSVVCL